MSYANIEVAQIAAISRNRCIGKGNELPWHISADLQHFKSMTTKQNDGAIQGIVIMGRKTFESMGSRPLPKRISFIITTQLDYAEQKGLEGSEKAYVMHNLDDALTQAANLAHSTNLDTIWVIGGERVFSEALRYTDRIELSHVDTEITDGDAFYPELPSEFAVARESEQMHDEKSRLDFKFVTYKRKA
ncbi:dihydrofolate reductase [Psychrobacter sp. AOP22-C1-22]|uniref:dihydrofolate reductase n=1 Tax=unclassified Psychrobacter TaxID=196806 RepID=UPI00178894E7|nr:MULTISPECIES: dihydrofolate reductase [unclassified Psychrobacter]MBE0406934.1 dihydrofolate reductase [Psychrobacter sp. FME6]MBE0445128.1 dihydrofolate reductase [Psychrobacter sp. FME5]MDN5801312.1 dihydrofolate reductase [Psychrobacter sp.]MDN5890529.1 dihydrofolate reductase [Psychrobacter sp.]